MKEVSLEHPCCKLPSLAFDLRTSCRRKGAQPIQALNPYNNNWTVKARVVSKTPIRTLKRDSNDPLQLFSIILVDEQVRLPKCILHLLNSVHQIFLSITVSEKSTSIINGFTH